VLMSRLTACELSGELAPPHSEVQKAGGLTQLSQCQFLVVVAAEIARWEVEADAGRFLWLGIIAIQQPA